MQPLQNGAKRKAEPDGLLRRQAFPLLHVIQQGLARNILPQQIAVLPVLLEADQGGQQIAVLPVLLEADQGGDPFPCQLLQEAGLLPQIVDLG